MPVVPDMDGTARKWVEIVVRVDKVELNEEQVDGNKEYRMDSADLMSALLLGMVVPKRHLVE
jgi:hypothetical protein